MRALFLADAHLHRPDDAAYRALLRLLEREAGTLTHLILLGDIFEFITGHDRLHGPDHRPALDAFAALRAKGVELIYLEGNHDFCLAPGMEQRLGAQIVPRTLDLELGGQRCHLCHGDLIAPTLGYRTLRWFFRSPLVQSAIRLAPVALTRGIADRAGAASSRRRQRQIPLGHLPEAALWRYARQQWERGAQVVVCGHFHRDGLLQEGDRALYSVGSWRDQRSLLWLTDSGFQPGQDGSVAT